MAHFSSASSAESSTKGDGAAGDRELRLALVCYGGVSLAVYMHAITREVLKLVRASRLYHALPMEQRGSVSYAEAARSVDTREAAEASDTEPVYFELLQALGGYISLRVVVDVVAGASAGGITGIMLARALAFDLSLDTHRDFWLDLADITELLDPKARAGIWSKPYMRPFFWLAGHWYRRKAEHLGAAGQDAEVLRKLSLFMRSRWFEPPFSGRRMSEMMLDALRGLGDEDRTQRSLLPTGLPLELFVTTTDFWGYRRSMTLHDPPEIEEHEHRHTLHFLHRSRVSGELESQLSKAHIPSLAFAARATSSFPGAFPPARLAEMDALLRERGLAWPGRPAFLEQQLAELRQAGENPEGAAFIDGSVLMNKPISVALRAVQRHAAHRETDRRLVYLEPNPELERYDPMEVPGFFATLKGALSDIPRHQPIRDDLESIERFNAQVRLQRQVLEAVKPAVMRMITDALGERLATPPEQERLQRWRHTANELAARDAGYAYQGYARLKVVSVLEELAELLYRATPLTGIGEARQCIEAWARRAGIRPLGDAAAQAQWGGEVPWVAFLRRFDIRHRLRRVLLLIRRSNELYHEGTAPRNNATRHWLDGIKLELYEQAERLQAGLDWGTFAAQLETSDAEGSGDPDGVDALLEQAAQHLDLPAMDDALDALLSGCADTCPDEELGRELVIAYLGFAYYDVLTYPMTQSRDLDALEEIKVDRISIDDANSLRQGGARELLMGLELGSFGAFFSRRYRENDYLWGRLTGAERLVDIVASAVPEAAEDDGLDLAAIKKRLFLAILAAEASQLGEAATLIAELKAEAERL